jgi:hypothetical protein
MNIIEKLESFQQQLIGVGQTAAACDLQNIIEEYKATEQEHVAYMDAQKVCCLSVLMVKELESRGNSIPWDLWPTKLFTNPQLSDETVKDAERYRWIRNRALGNGFNFDTPEGIGRFEVKQKTHKGQATYWQGDRLDAAIDEAMKADNEPS